MSTFDAEFHELLGSRPPMTPGHPSVENRQWDLAYQALFPSDAMPSYHESRRKKSTTNSVLLTALEPEASTNVAA